MNPFRPKIASVTVQYDRRGKRVRKTFADAYAARRFYAAKFKAGRPSPGDGPGQLAGGAGHRAYPFRPSMRSSESEVW